jgi:hypothetical protein
MSTPLGALTLLPPDPPRPAVPPQPGGAVAWGARQARTRRWLTGVGVFGALFPLVMVAAGPYLGEIVYGGMAVCWGFLFPGCGLAVLLIAAVNRTRADAEALLLGIASIVVSLVLAEPVGRAASEAYLSSHGVELDRAAAEWVANRAQSTELPAGGVLVRSGIRRAREVDGGVLFSTSFPFGPAFFYADRSMETREPGCDLITPAGGRWYLWQCSDSMD